MTVNDSQEGMSQDHEEKDAITVEAHDLQSKIITHKYSLEQYKEALEVVMNKRKHHAIKTIFEFQ